jgi:hypothetical protein
MSTFDNKIHSFSLEEILEKTNIKLEKDWDIFMTPFQIGKIKVHEENCAIKFLTIDEWDEDKCNCNYYYEDRLAARIMGYPSPTFVGDKKYFNCTIPEKIEDFKNEEWKLPYDDFPTLIQEDILNGLCTIAEIVKVYEITGSDNYDFLELKMPDGSTIPASELQSQIYAR